VGEPRIDRAKDPRTIVINEYTLFPEHCASESADLYFDRAPRPAWVGALGAALGAKLARPESPVMAVVGDGAFMFTPAAVHHALGAARFAGPVLSSNNSAWGAVERSTLAMYRDGLRLVSNEPPFVRLGKLPAFEEICKAAGGHGERVEDPAALLGALERAMSIVKNEQRQALLNVICGAGGTA
jgi:acetolactate synthase-1/2/3 large subunit